MLLLCILQSSMSVLGSFILHQTTVTTQPLSVSEWLSLCATAKGLSGIVLMVLSFSVLVYTLSQHRASVVIPVNTAVSFLVTLLLGYIFNAEKMTVSAVAGMVMICSGIALVVRNQ